MTMQDERKLQQTGGSAIGTEAPVALFKAIAHPIRYQILQLLADKSNFGVEEEDFCASTEVCVCRMTTLFEVSMPTISHHLKVLREAGLIKGRRAGVWIYYSLQTDALTTAIGSLQEVRDLARDKTEGC